MPSVRRRSKQLSKYNYTMMDQYYMLLITRYRGGEIREDEIGDVRSVNFERENSVGWWDIILK
jgi:hypothetical protein